MDQCFPPAVRSSLPGGPRTCYHFDINLHDDVDTKSGPRKAEKNSNIQWWMLLFCSLPISMFVSHRTRSFTIAISTRVWKHPEKKMFWLCFSYDGVGTLQAICAPSNTVKFFQRELFNCWTNDSFTDLEFFSHTSKILKSFMTHKHTELLGWSGNSPDRNRNRESIIVL